MSRDRMFVKYTSYKKAVHAKLFFLAIEKMPSKTVINQINGKPLTANLGKYGQQSALARELGYKGGHNSIYANIRDGCLPSTPERRRRLLELAGGYKAMPHMKKYGLVASMYLSELLTEAGFNPNNQ